MALEATATSPPRPHVPPLAGEASEPLLRLLASSVPVAV